MRPLENPAIFFVDSVLFLSHAVKGLGLVFICSLSSFLLSFSVILDSFAFILFIDTMIHYVKKLF